MLNDWDIPKSKGNKIMDIRSLEYPDLIGGLANLSEEKLNTIIKDVEQARQEIKKSKLSLIKRRILFFDFEQTSLLNYKLSSFLHILSTRL